MHGVLRKKYYEGKVSYLYTKRRAQNPNFEDNIHIYSLFINPARACLMKDL
jgi:hypothetical protein